MRMKDSTVFRIARGANPGLFVLGILCITLLAIAPAATATELTGLTVTGVDRGAGGVTTEVPVPAYRWLVEEDKTYHVGFDPLTGNPISVPDLTDPNWDANWDNTLSVSFHKSYMPLVAKGCVGFDDLDPDMGTPENLSLIHI